jgi:hypothetical protein
VITDNNQVFAGSGTVTGLKESRPEWFGTGTNAIQLAINSINGAGTVRLGPNTYISDKLTLPGLISLIGVGEKSTVIQLMNSATGHLINVPSTSRDVTIEKISLRGNSANQSVAYDGIHLDATTPSTDARLTARDVFVEDFKGNGIYIGTNRQASHFYNVRSWSNLLDGFSINAPDNAFITCSAGHNGGNGFSILESVTSVVGGESFNNGAVGYYFGSLGFNSHVMSASADRNDEEGIRLTGFSNQIIGNTIHSNSQSSHGTYSDVYDSAGRNIIEHNSFRDGSGTSVLPQYHIKITAAGTYSSRNTYGTTNNRTTADVSDSSRLLYTNSVQGTTTAGTCTYSGNVISYQINGRFITFTLNINYTGHTGTGNIQIVPALPFPPVGIFAGIVPLTIYPVSGIAYTGPSLSAYLDTSGNISIRQTTTGGVSSGVPIPADANVVISGTYEY